MGEARGLGARETSQQQRRVGGPWSRQSTGRQQGPGAGAGRETRAGDGPAASRVTSMSVPLEVVMLLDFVSCILLRFENAGREFMPQVWEFRVPPRGCF